MKRVTSELFRASSLLFLWLALALTPAFAATSATNTATIAPPAGLQDINGGCDAATPPTCAGNNTSFATVGVWAVTVSKSANPASGSVVIAGQTMRYTLTATVTGSATTAATVLTDTLGANLTFGSVTAPGAFTAGGAGQVRTFTLPSGTASGTYSVTYTATVNAGATGSVNNAVTGAPCTTVGGCTTTNPIGNVTVSKALTAESGTQAGIAEAGETLTYTITLSNPSTVAVTNYALTDVLSAGLSYVSSTSGGVNAGQTTNWTGLAVPASGTLQVTVVARVNTPIASTSVSNLAKPTNGGQDPVCPSGACVVTPTSSTVTVAKSANPASGSVVIAGQTMRYTLTATVTGSATTAATVLTDTLGREPDVRLGDRAWRLHARRCGPGSRLHAALGHGVWHLLGDLHGHGERRGHGFGEQRGDRCTLHDRGWLHHHQPDRQRDGEQGAHRRKRHPGGHRRGR